MQGEEEGCGEKKKEASPEDVKAAGASKKILRGQADDDRAVGLDLIRVDNVLVPMQSTEYSGYFPQGKRAATARRYPAFFSFFL